MIDLQSIVDKAFTTTDNVFGTQVVKSVKLIEPGYSSADYNEDPTLTSSGKTFKGIKALLTKQEKASPLYSSVEFKIIAKTKDIPTVSLSSQIELDKQKYEVVKMDISADVVTTLGVRSV